MAKRFTDTDKWKKPFIRALPTPYKLLWFYIVDDCDHAGIWQVDFEVARIRIGEDVTYEQAAKLFGDKIFVIEKFKWFVPDFVFFQYGELSEKNRLHVSVLNLLSKHNLGASKPLVRGQEQGQGIGQGKGTIQGKGKNEIFEEIFTDQIFMDQISFTHKGKDLKQAWEECYTHHSNAPNPPRATWEWKQKLNTWLTIKSKEGNGKSKKSGLDAQSEVESIYSRTGNK